MHLESARSLRRAYLNWIEEQVEGFKESIPRSDLLRIADQAIDDTRDTQHGQLELTELVLCDIVDRKIIRMLKLPTYKHWAAVRRKVAEAAAEANADLDTTVVLPRETSAPARVGVTQEVTSQRYRQPESFPAGVEVSLVGASG